MKTIYGLFLVLCVLIPLNFIHSIYFNIFTHSLPYGVYIKIKGVPQRGDFAATCLTQEIAQFGITRGYLAKGNCDTGTVRVLKKIIGMPGDRFIVNNGFLELNGSLYPILNFDSSGRTLKLFYKENKRVLAKGEYVLLSDFVNNSWDSRYWGPVSVQFLLKPLWIFENVKR